MKKNILNSSGNILHNNGCVWRYFTDRKRFILFISGIILLGLFNILFTNSFTNSTSALEYQSTTPISFTVNPTVSVSVSGNLTISNLSPGSGSDSNIITVTASSNAIAGYSLSSTVGDSNNASTELRKDNTNTIYKFSSITTNKPTLSDFDSNSNTWGYSYSTDSGSTWISGDIKDSPLSGYNGLPVYTTDTPITLINATSEGTNTIEFKIAASSTNNQVAGEYNNIINFIGLANINPVTFDDLFSLAGKTKYNGYYTMQDMSSSICSNALRGSSTYLIDNRDGEIYLISKLNDDNCWTLDNLRLDLTDSTIMNGLTTTNTHVDAASLTSLKSGNRSAGDQYASSGFAKWDSSSPSDTYNQAKANADYKDTTTTSYGAGSGKIGVYYNYCAASAGSYCYDGEAGTGNAQYDLCPAGWRMPTGGSSGEYNNLYANGYSSDATNFRNALSTPLSGYFVNGSAGGQGSGGNFWSSSSTGGSNMYNLNVNSGSVNPTDSSNRLSGLSVRCILGS